MLQSLGESLRTTNTIEGSFLEGWQVGTGRFGPGDGGRRMNFTFSHVLS